MSSNDHEDKAVSSASLPRGDSTSTSLGQGWDDTIPKLPEGFRMEPDGLHYEDKKGDHLIAGRFSIVGATRDFEGKNCGVEIHWRDRDGKGHSITLLRRDLATPLRSISRLADEGLFVAHGAERLVARALNDARPETALRRVDRVGWHRDDVFVLPNQTCALGNEDVRMYDADHVDHGFGMAGSPHDWKEGPAALARGNAILMFAVAVALTGPALDPTGAENTVFHLHGASSTGKTTVARLAASVWGAPNFNGFMRTWRTTSNALELTLKGRFDTCLILDEVQMAAASDVAEAAYMISSGAGKGRMTRELRKAETAKWRLSALSTGELSLEAYLRTSGLGITAGQSVRFIDLPADAGADIGVFQALNGFESATALSIGITRRADDAHGTAGPAFVRAMLRMTDRGRTVMAETRKQFESDNCPRDADGQVRRVCAKFGLVAAAGKLAADTDVVPWSADEAMWATRESFSSWLRERGHVGSHEVKTAVERLRKHLRQLEPGLEIWSRAATRSREGYRRPQPEHLRGLYIFVDTIDEILRDTDKKAVLSELKRNNWLRTERDRLTVQAKDPVTDRNRRFYHFTFDFLEDGEPVSPTVEREDALAR